MFMQFPIDVVFLDQDLNVLKISADTRPFHAASCRGAREVVELRAGECARRGLSVGDRVAWASSQKPSTDAPRAGVQPADPQRSNGSVVVASRDERFVKLLRLLLDARRIEFSGTVEPTALTGALADAVEGTVAVLDLGDGAAEGLAVANAGRSLHPDIPILLVGTSEVVARAPFDTRIYDKWAESEALVDALLTALQGVDSAWRQVSP